MLAFPLISTPNKAFKRDLARVAFLVCVEFSGYGALQKLLYRVPAPLNAALAVKRSYKLIKNIPKSDDFTTLSVQYLAQSIDLILNTELAFGDHFLNSEDMTDELWEFHQGTLGNSLIDRKSVV